MPGHVCSEMKRRQWTSHCVFTAWLWLCGFGIQIGVGETWLQAVFCWLKPQGEVVWRERCSVRLCFNSDQGLEQILSVCRTFMWTLVRWKCSAVTLICLLSLPVEWGGLIVESQQHGCRNQWSFEPVNRLYPDMRVWISSQSSVKFTCCPQPDQPQTQLTLAVFVISPAGISFPHSLGAHISSRQEKNKKFFALFTWRDKWGMRHLLSALFV